MEMHFCISKYTTQKGENQHEKQRRFGKIVISTQTTAEEKEEADASAAWNGQRPPHQ
jgi:hypothetical protein